ncbi:hypothetical protein CFC21_013905 [Triticum aestivum]|uniref:DUF3143 domain-containing protein n=2 Tax=Triticum aestivum TaxID=4565 RepID=A0A3B6A321_WHEAT|nr:uncharacterized protein LOC123183193 [Triticum aestivum]KAF6997710.1 hypothetical protein CFC21_013905 [Triticum aestivum]
MSMAVPSSLRALAPPALLPYPLGTSGSARPSPAHRAARGMMVARRRGVALAAAAVAADAGWLERLPEKEKPLYAHSLPCIEAWLRSVGFAQSREDRAVWVAETPVWHARLSLDVTDLHIRYLKSGPGNLEKDMERRFSYALSRQDIENAILGGP